MQHNSQKHSVLHLIVPFQVGRPFTPYPSDSIGPPAAGLPVHLPNHLTRYLLPPESTLCPSTVVEEGERRTNYIDSWDGTFVCNLWVNLKWILWVMLPYNA